MIKKRKKEALFAAALLLAWLPRAAFPQDGAPRPSGSRPPLRFSLSLGQAPAAPPAVPRAGQAAPRPSAPALSGNRDDFSFRALTRDFLKDAGQIWGYPLHIQTGDILPIAGLAALTGLLIENDEAISLGFRNYHDSRSLVRTVGTAITPMGSWGAWGTAAVFLGVGLIGRDKKSTETAVLASSAMLQSEILVVFLKGMFGRQRPYYADGVDHWSGPVGFFKRFAPGQSARYNSFPGGHGITAFSLATVMAMQYRETVWVPILAYSVATGVGLSRVSESKHWFSDCLVGGVLGYFIGRLVVRNHRNRYHLMPLAGLDHGTVSLSVTLCR